MGGFLGQVLRREMVANDLQYREFTITSAGGSGVFGVYCVNFV